MRRRDAIAAMLSLGAAVPLGACEQQTGRTEHTGQTWRVGLLLTGLTEEAVARQRRVIVERLERHGFVEGQNLRIEVRRAGHSPAEDDEAIRPLVASPPDAILVDSSTLTTRTREATRTIPIVFTGVADPIGTGLINNFSRPGGNATGVHYSQLEIGAKRLELLRDLLPQARRVMVVRYLAGGELDMLPHLRNTASRLGSRSLRSQRLGRASIPHQRHPSTGSRTRSTTGNDGFSLARSTSSTKSFGLPPSSVSLRCSGKRRLPSGALPLPMGST